MENVHKAQNNYTEKMEFFCRHIYESKMYAGKYVYFLSNVSAKRLLQKTREFPAEMVCLYMYFYGEICQDVINSARNFIDGSEP